MLEGSVLVEAVAVGVWGIDVEIVEGKYGWAPPGKTRLVLGHESLVARGNYGSEVARLWATLRTAMNNLARAYGCAPLAI